MRLNLWQGNKTPEKNMTFHPIADCVGQLFADQFNGQLNLLFEYYVYLPQGISTFILQCCVGIVSMISIVIRT